MTLFEVFAIAACFGILFWVARFALVAFWPDNPISQMIERDDR